MFKIPNITEAKEMAENMSQSQVMALHYVSCYIINKQLHNKDEAIEWRRAKSIEPSYLINLEKELNSLGFKITVDYEVKRFSCDYEDHVYMKIKVSPIEI